MSSKKVLALKKEPSSPPLDQRREEDFVVKYANHVAVEPNGWDLKLLFGRVDTSAGPNVVVQHTAISLPWPSIKVLIYVLRVQLAAYEKGNGHVPFPLHGLNPMPRSVPEEFLEMPNAQEIHNAVLKLYDEFVAENPEAFPEKSRRDS